MKIYTQLPSPPEHKISVVERFEESSGFLVTKATKYRFNYDDQSTKEMVVDSIDRTVGNSAVAILAYTTSYMSDSMGQICVYLRSCIRPALHKHSASNQWEIPAGIIENESVESAASRELMEEVGIYANPNYFHSLGKPYYSSVGVSGELIHLVKIEANPQHIQKAESDGSPLEYGGQVILVTIDGILKAIDSGQIQDSKTILAITRFVLYNK